MITLKINLTTNQITDTDNLMYEIKLKTSVKILAAIKKFLISTKSKYYDDSNKLAIEKMKDETGVLQLKNLLD